MHICDLCGGKDSVMQCTLDLRRGIYGDNPFGEGSDPASPELCYHCRVKIGESIDAAAQTLQGKDKPCQHLFLRVQEATDFCDAVQGNYRYVCTECGQEITVPMRGEVASVLDFDAPGGFDTPIIIRPQ